MHSNPMLEDRFAIFDTQLIIRFDFATTRSSSPSYSSWGVFNIVLDSLIGLKWLQENTEKLMMLNKRRNLFHPSRVQISELVFGVNIFDLDLGIQVDSVKKTI